MTPEEALEKARVCAAMGAVGFAPGPKVSRYPDILERFMTVVVGSTRWFVSDESHLSDFDLGAEELEAIDREFGVRLPSTDLYLWEALFVLASSNDTRA